MRLLITDLTYMRGGVCIAGINIETLKHIRPVLSYGQIQRDFIKENNICPGAIVRFALTPKRDIKPPHIEDHIFENAEFIKFVNQVEWYERLSACADTSLKSAFGNCITENKGIIPHTDTSSLAIIKLTGNIRVNFFDSDSGAILPFKMRLTFSSDGIYYHLPVTDLQFIDYCNGYFLSSRKREELKRELEGLINSSEHIFLSIGLTRPFKKSEDSQELCYLQVNSIYSERIDNIVGRSFISGGPKYQESTNKEDKKIDEPLNTLQFTVFNIPLTDNYRELQEMNSFIKDIEIKRFSANITGDRFWSILIGYIRGEKTNTKTEKLSFESISELNEEEINLYERLRKWRSEKARSLNLPEYMVFPNKTLMTLAKIKPSSIEGLTNITGIAEKKIADHGNEIIELINKEKKLLML